MLVLSRRMNESIILTIGQETVEVKVHRIGPTSVKLAIDAPQSVHVRRAELPVGLVYEGKTQEWVYRDGNGMELIRSHDKESVQMILDSWQNSET